ncbi:hypothetical protein Sste5346_006181 [Sporothrix stenoceras]|uniref:Thioester reductase (TE) domain-containing protein n=1 Tax=Sporothrix stenoceras TaxID=5173 RepID=A0ABR3Z091_9PEZI
MAISKRTTTDSRSHLEVVAGDLALPLFGLDQSDFDRLALDADQVVHPGALVNYRLSYQNLFEPNIKRLDYVSTISVPNANGRLRDSGQQADMRLAAYKMPLFDSYAAGYTISKWEGEVLLQDVRDLNVFRPDDPS